MSTLATDDSSTQIRTLYKEITLLKKLISEKQTAHSSKKKKKKNKVSKPKNSKRSFHNPSLVQNSSAPSSHSPNGGVENDASNAQSEQQWVVSSDGKSVISARIFRGDLSKLNELSSRLAQEEQMEKVRAIAKLKKKLAKYKFKYAMCDRVLINGEKYSVVENGYMLFPLTYYKNAGDDVFWNDHWYKVTNSGYYKMQGCPRKYVYRCVKIYITILTDLGD